VADLATRNLDVVSFARAVNEVVTTLYPAPVPPCWTLVDPASLLITGSFDGLGGGMSHQMLVEEYLEDGTLKTMDIVRSTSSVCTLDELISAHPDPEVYAREMRAMHKYGIEDAAAATIRTTSGQPWGAVVYTRSGGRFDRKDIDFLKTITPHVAQGVQRGFLVGEATDPEGPEPPGLVVLDEDWGISSATPGVERWLADLSTDGPDDRELPPAVVSVAARALRTVQGEDAPGEVAVARVLTQSGRWVLLHGAAMVADGTRRAAVIVEPAHPARITPLLMAAYGLTEREQDVTRRVLCGDSTADIAAALFVSPHTVQQHLKSIFEKTGVRSRRELVGKVFFAHYEPRVRDNEQRVDAHRPIRGGPYPYWPDTS
jgi:DNA-binding CsgD family transcriptional regulator